MTLGLYANGEMYYNGKMIKKRDLTVKGGVPPPYVPPDAMSSTNAKDSIDGVEMKNEDEVKNDESNIFSVSEEIVTEDKVPLLFGQNSLLCCELDTGSDGGTLNFFVNGVRLEEFEMRNLYKLLGGTELYPSICLCPLGPAPELEEEKDGDENDNEEGTEKKKKKKKETSKNEEDNENDDADENDESGKIEDLYLLYPSVLLFCGDDAISDADSELSRRLLNIANSKTPDAEQDGAKPDPAEDPQSETENDGSKDNKPKESEETDNRKSEDAAEPTTEANAPEDIKVAVDSPQDTAADVEVPVEKVVWMYETEEDGWIVYGPEISKELEEAHRAGNVDHTLLYGDETFRCQLEAKTQKTDDNRQQKMRRHVLSDGAAAMWETLTLKYEKPLSLSGQGMLKTLEKIWAGDTKLSDGLGFIFLYTLLSGDVKCRAVPGYGSGAGTLSIKFGLN